MAAHFCGQVRVVAPEMTKPVCQNGALKRKLVICCGEKPTIKRRRPSPTSVDVAVQNPRVGIGIEWGYDSEEEWVPVRKLRC